MSYDSLARKTHLRPHEIINWFIRMENKMLFCSWCVKQFFLKFSSQSPFPLILSLKQYFISEFCKRIKIELRGHVVFRSSMPMLISRAKVSHGQAVSCQVSWAAASTCLWIQIIVVIVHVVCLFTGVRTLQNDWVGFLSFI